jgi:voltage-gated potassium channel
VRERLYRIIFEADTPAGKAFDVGLLVAIVASVVVVLLDSVRLINAEYSRLLHQLEWLFTILFTVEYVLRLYCVQRPGHYARSFFGIIDLLSVLPTYMSLFLVGSQQLIVIRVLRLLRIFRVFKLARYLGHANILLSAMKSSMPKIIVFLGTVMTVVVVVGTAMFMIEGSVEGTRFSSIPQCMYWAIVTVTTVGYGDITPESVAGKFLAAGLMILGYAIIAVPTGIVSAELVQFRGQVTTRTCPDCLEPGHDPDAVHCKHCGVKLLSEEEPSA